MVFGYKSYEIVAQNNMYLQIITFITKKCKIQKGLTSWPKMYFKLVILVLEIGLRTMFSSLAQNLRVASIKRWEEFTLTIDLFPSVKIISQWVFACISLRWYLFVCFYSLVCALFHIHCSCFYWIVGVYVDYIDL